MFGLSAKIEVTAYEDELEDYGVKGASFGLSLYLCFFLKFSGWCVDVVDGSAEVV